MSEQFDGYYKWLGIPPKDHPPNHYRLLSIELYEDNPEVIEASAERQATYLHEVSAGPHVKESQKLLNEIAAARLCLLDADKKAAYDEELRSKVTANVTVDALAGGHSPLDDLPWDNLEPLMTNGSSSDTAPQGQAASETLRLPAADPSGVFPKPKSLMAASPASPEAKASRPAMFWIVIGGGIAIAIALAVLLVLRSNTGDDEGLEQSQRGTPEIQSPPKPDKKDDQSGKKDAKPTPPAHVEKSNGTDPKNDKKDNEKKDGGKKPPKSNGNDTKQPVKPPETPRSTDHQTGTKNGIGKQPVVKKEPAKTKGFMALEPTEVTSFTRKTKLTPIGSNCVLAEGGAEEDVYTVCLKTDVPDITAIRVEALPHDSLAAKGPGLGDQGAFSILEVRLAAASSDSSEKSKELVLSGVESKESPAAVDKLIDGVSHTFWRVKRSGQPTVLTMFLKTPVWYENGTTLYLRLTQREKLGHFRVSVSNDADLAGRRTRIEADLPLFVNLGGGNKTDRAGRKWIASQRYEDGAFGFVGGMPAGNDDGAPFTCYVDGIKEFRAHVPNGKYNVRLLFSTRFPKDAGKRSFFVSAHGVKKKPIKDLPKYQYRDGSVPFGLENVEAKDGVLAIEFTGDKGSPVLNGIEIYPTK